MEWPNSTTFDATKIAPWQAVSEASKPSFADDEKLKNDFGIALGQGLDGFKAGMQLFKEHVPSALWVSLNWLKDPMVIAAKDAYLKAAKRARKPLDKEELLAEVLETAQDAPEFKDKAALLKLYSEIAGYTGKALIDNSIGQINNTQNNTTQIVLVKGAEDKAPKTTPDTNTQSKIPNSGLPNLKLVSGISR